MSLNNGKNQLETILEAMSDGEWYSPRDILEEFDILSSSSTAALRSLRTKEKGYNLVWLRRDVTGKTIYEYMYWKNPDRSKKTRNDELRRLGIDPHTLPDDFVWLHPEWENNGKLINQKIKEGTYRGYVMDWTPAYVAEKIGVKVTYTDWPDWKGFCSYPISFIDVSVKNSPNIKHIYLEIDGRWVLVYINQ